MIRIRSRPGKTDMANWQQMMERFARLPADVVGLDCASDSLRAVHMRKTGAGLAILGMDRLPPPFALDPPLDETGADRVRAVSLPPRLRAKYAALNVPGRHAVIKLLRISGSFDAADPAQVAAKLGIPEPEGYRLAARPLTAAPVRGETRVLAVALPEWETRALLRLTPHGLPAPYSVAVSELSVVDAFLYGPGAGNRDEAMGMLHFDQDRSVFALFNRGVLSQLRTFDFGVGETMRHVRKALEVDAETAQDIVENGAVDISHLVANDLRQIGKQLIICRDFMERSENCHLAELHISGPAALVRQFTGSLQTDMRWIEWSAPAPWLPADDSQQTAEQQSQAWRLAAAVGACLRVLEPK